MGGWLGGWVVIRWDCKISSRAEISKSDPSVAIEHYSMIYFELLSLHRHIGLCLVFGSWNPWNSVIFIILNFLVLVLVSNMTSTKSLGIGLELFTISRLVLVLVLTEIPNQDQYWYWSQTNFNFKTSLGIGLDRNLKSRQVLVLVLNKISGLAELWFMDKRYYNRRQGLTFLGNTRLWAISNDKIISCSIS